MKNQKLRRKIGLELKEFLAVFLFLVPFFLLLHGIRDLCRAAVRGIFLSLWDSASERARSVQSDPDGELAGLGRQLEKKPLLVSTLYKSAVFTILFIAFRILENIVHGCIHGQPLAGALDAELVFGKAKLLSLAAIIFLAFIPFFALREVRRVLGNDHFHNLFFGRGQPFDVDALRRIA